MRSVTLALATTALLAPTAAPAAGQSFWLPATEGPSVALEVLRAGFVGDSDVAGTTGVLFLSGRLPVGERLGLVLELPVARAAFDPGPQFGGTALGNPYLGVEIGDRNEGLLFEVGARPPLAGDDKFLVHFVSSMTEFDRLEAFFPDNLSVSALASHRTEDPDTGLTLRLRGGPIFSYYVKHEEEARSHDLYLGYGVQAHYLAGPARLLGGITGRYMVTDDEPMDIAERATHQLGVAASLANGPVRPGLHLRIPLDQNLSDFINYVVGIQLQVPIP